jgi:hypothetical protein
MSLGSSPDIVLIGAFLNGAAHTVAPFACSDLSTSAVVPMLGGKDREVPLTTP